MTTTTRRLSDRRSRTLATRAFVALATIALVGLGCRAQNANDAPTGSVSAAFSQSAASGQPGLMVSFTNASTGDFDSLLWNFGNTETSSDPNPTVQYDDPGTYRVSLTLTSAQGSNTATSEVVVAEMPTAGLSCTPELGFVPATVSCTSTATGAVDTRYEVVETGAIVDGASATFDLGVAGTYTVRQTVDNGIGDVATDSVTVDVYDLAIAASVPSGSAPIAGPIAFSPVTTAPPAQLDAWLVDGVIVGIGSVLQQALGEPGTYTITYQYGSSSPPLMATTEIQYVVAFGAPDAAFEVSTAEGPGPLDVTFTDTSTGTLNGWRWEFGDGTACDFPAPEGVDPDDPTVCDSASPTHTYDAIGRYDVTLTITGEDTDPNDPDLTDSVTVADAVTVTILDPSFEAQSVGTTLDVGWTAITPASATASAEHVALAQNAGGADAGMPTEGSRWAALDGLGTNGTEAALVVENGICQDFLRPSTASVLEFDYVLLYSEPPAGAVMDAMTATVSDGTTTVEIVSARTDVTSPFAGGSARYPTLDGSTTRATPVRTASLDLATAFPGAAADQVYTLTIRLTNDVNDFRSPRAYVDDVRFTEPADPFTASFSAPATIIVGEPADFLDETCLGVGGCVDPTSFRWDFDTHLGAAAVTASGSGEQNPSYTFVESGDFDVRLLARNADQESLATMTVTVLEAAVAIPAVQSIVYSGGGGTTAPATVDFEDQSTSDPSDPIVAWSWDFGGWGTSSAPSPTNVAINQAGTWTIRLTITTASGQTDTRSLDLVID